VTRHNVTKFIFDISTSAKWSGNPVGIVRVERELAQRAKRHLGDGVAFSVFNLKTNDFHILKDRYVDSILNGDVSIDFDQAPHIPLTSGTRRRLRDMALEVPHAYRLIQRLRGHRFSAHEVRVIRDQMRSTAAAKSDASNLLPLNEATKEIAELNTSTAIISGGLDWEHKNVRKLYHLKTKVGFRYFNIIYDLIPVDLPQYVMPRYVTLLHEYFGELLWVSDGCLCISNTTQEDLRRFCQQNNVDRFPIKTFRLGSYLEQDEGEHDLPFELNGKRYVLYVSTIEPRKNHRTAYEAWCHGLLSGKLNPDVDRLVFVGRQGWNIGDLIHEMKANPLTKSTILILENISDGLLNELYRKSVFVIFPSYYEGFGLPLAEAFARGKVCVTSGAGALSEIGPQYRIDLDPRDVLRWSATISELLADQGKVLKLEQTIKANYQNTTWDQSAKFFYDELKSMIA
jgi:glycosyltransferase involved in cell wall biosynthesis